MHARVDDARGVRLALGEGRCRQARLGKRVARLRSLLAQGRQAFAQLGERALGILKLLPQLGDARLQRLHRRTRLIDGARRILVLAFDLLALGAQRSQLALGVVGVLAGGLRRAPRRSEALRELQALRLGLMLRLLGRAGLGLKIRALGLLRVQTGAKLIEHTRTRQDAVLALRRAGRPDEHFAGRPYDLAGLRHEPRAERILCLRR